MVHTVFHKVDVDLEKKVLEECIKHYEMFIETSASNDELQISYYRNVIAGLKKRIKKLDKAPRASDGKALLKWSVVVSQKKER